MSESTRKAGELAGSQFAISWLCNLDCDGSLKDADPRASSCYLWQVAQSPQVGSPPPDNGPMTGRLDRIQSSEVVGGR